MKTLILNLTIFLFLIFNSCGLPPKKTLNHQTKKELNDIKKELGADNLTYGYNKYTKNGKTELYFRISIFDIPKVKSVKEYNIRLIRAFEKSGYNFKECTAVSFFYMKNYADADLIKHYKTDLNGNILYESDR